MNKIYGSSIPLDSDLLRTFLAVARHRNVTHAAEAVHRTQSAVSVQIKRLEERLGTRLFRREARGVSLTDAGERLQRAADRIVRDLDQTASEFKRDPIGGTVRVGIPDDYGSDVLAGILREFAARHPLVEVSVRCEFGTKFHTAIERDDLDLAICTDECSPIGASTFFEEQTVWVCARGLHISEDQPVPLALFDRTCWWRDVAINALQQTGRAYRIAYSSESVSGVKAALSAGLAVGVLARSTIDPSMRVLGNQDGFPDLPKTGLSLFENAQAPSAAVSAMADAIRRGFSKIASPV
ncbi:MAG: LysR substrate-binding domain-containing protein [Gammaproteobacteria bacterium]|nr:LysR substrate-binding domain-containing protein [Gammaproteobacteria bacterium]